MASPGRGTPAPTRKEANQQAKAIVVGVYRLDESGA
jgi:hypothetical protein